MAFPDFVRHSAFARIIRPYRRAWSERRRERREYRHLDQADISRIQFYSQFFKAGNLVFDVGANFGSRTKAFLALGANVVAFEPQPQCADFLERVLGRNRRFTLVRKALGSSDGKAEMRLSEHSVLSSLNPNWIKATKESGRFASVEWNDSIEVQVTTLAGAIQKFGNPAFIKIDVEGFEKEVVLGLTRPVRCLSLEFSGEYIEASLECISHLEKLGPIECQISYGESLKLALGNWCSPEVLRRTLSKISRLDAGDLYLRSR